MKCFATPLKAGMEAFPLVTLHLSLVTGFWVGYRHRQGAGVLQQDQPEFLTTLYRLPSGGREDGVRNSS